MALAKVTVTAKTGGGVANSAFVINGATGLILDFNRQVIRVVQGDITGPGQEFDMGDTATLTDTIAGVKLGHTIAISS